MNPTLGVVNIPGVTPFDQALAPPILGVDQSVSFFNPGAPGPLFGVLVFQGFAPFIDPVSQVPFPI
jgi:hypothetical protein